MTLRIIKQSIGGSRFQKILALVTIIASTLLISCMLNITLGIGNQIARDLRSFGSNIVVLPKGASLSVEVGDSIYSPLQNESYLDESRLHLIKEIFWRNNITAFAPFLDAKVSYEKIPHDALNSPLDLHSADFGIFEASQTPSLASAPKIPKNHESQAENPSVVLDDSQDSRESKQSDSRESSVILIGTYFDKTIGVQDEPEFSTGVKMLYPTWSIDGAWVEDDALDFILVGNEFAKRENLKIGDKIALDSPHFRQIVTISGILSQSGIYDNRILGSIALAQKFLGKENVFAKAEVSAFTIPENTLSYKARRNIDSLNAVEFDTWYCSAFASSIAYQIEEDFKGTSAKAQIKVSDAESSIVRKIQGLMGVTSIICLLVSSVGISALLSAEFQRRRKEIGLMKVLGANLWQIYVIFAGESCVIAIFGAIIGFFGGVGVAELISISIFAHALPISWIALPLSIVFALFISLCGSLFLLKNINTLLPAQVLYGR